MAQKILYLGDTALDQAASYLAGILDHKRIEFDYVDSDTKFDDELLTADIDAAVISDYPSSNFTATQLDAIVERVKGGMGMLMIGGWDTFTGLAGGYNKTVLAEVLPIAMSDADDRMNYYAPCVIRQNVEHQLVEGAPFARYPACIAGYNRLTAKPDSQVILSVDKRRIIEADGELTFESLQVDPLLVAGKFGKGRVLAYAGDVAPHWAGGFVDWGSERIVLQAPGAGDVEVGNWYVNFFSNLINWLCK